MTQLERRKPWWEKDISTFEVTEVEHRVRKMRVVEISHSTVQVWHGGRLLDELSTFLDVEDAIEEVAEKAAWFGVGPESTLRIRVAEQVNWEYRTDDDSQKVCRTEHVRQRHIHDFHRGQLAFDEVKVGFRLVMPIGFAVGEDPGDQLPSYFIHPAGAKKADQEFMFAGYGIGKVEDIKVSRLPLPAPAPVFVGHPEGALVEMTGTIQAFVPPGTAHDVALAQIRKHVSIPTAIHWQKNERAATRWGIYSGPPKVTCDWTLIEAVAPEV